MIKKTGILCLLLIACQAMYGQKTVEQMFNEFSNHHQTEKVSIGKFAMSFANLFKDTMGVNGIEVLSLENCDNDLKERFKEAIRSVKDPSFETMVNSNENGERTKVMLRIKDDVIHELVVLTTGDEPAMVRIRGKIKKSDIEKLVNEHS